jgi:hypothetical protein
LLVRGEAETNTSILALRKNRITQKKTASKDMQKARFNEAGFFDYVFITLLR